MKHKKRAWIQRVPWYYWFALVYVGLLMLSHCVRFFTDATGPIYPDQQRMSLPEIAQGQPTGEVLEIAYRDLKPDNHPEAPVVVLVHGSPMASQSMNALVDALKNDFRLIVPDLPGFGGSTLDIADYSIEAHGHYLKRLLDELGISQAHYLGYSQGGGVILHVADMQPEQVQSLTMLAAIGVQELELLGDYTLNHGLYATQLGLLWLLQEWVPHFGSMDAALLNVAYARNFWDSDQRPLRSILQQYDGPMLIVHGEADFLVPMKAAREHQRLVPQSEFKAFPQGHMLPFDQAAEVGSVFKGFVAAVESNEAQTRSQVSAEARAEALEPMPSSIRVSSFNTQLFYGGLLILGTQIAEDLSCIAGGLMASRGVISYWMATLACLLGIFIGDMWLYYAGRYLGRPALKKAPFKWLLREKDVAGMERWFQKRGPAIIMTARFIPGSRLPTYFSAGVVKVPIRKFVFYFLAAACIWTPALVWLTYTLGDVVIAYFESFEGYAASGLVGFIVFYIFCIKILVPMLSWKGRRLLLSKWKRWVNWEFWPMWLFYPPVIVYIIWLGLKHRSFTLFTAVNPAMPASGVIEESKSDILKGLNDDAGYVARWELVDVSSSTEAKLKQLQQFMQMLGTDYPIVLKPDVGQRGEGVAIVKNEAAAISFFEHCPEDVIIQEFIPGCEYGVFYYRYPGEEKGKILGITDKRFISVVGNGIDTLETLILSDTRAVAMARFFLEKHSERLSLVPEKGESYLLAELGTHCRGSLFCDGSDLLTPQLETIFDEISQKYTGFYFGRYDIRVASPEAFQKGETIKILELNGVTSEATYIYDPKHSLLYAWKTLFRQWRIAFEIAEANVANGSKISSASDLLDLYLKAKSKETFEA